LFLYNPLNFNYIYYFEIKKIRGQDIRPSVAILLPHSGMLWLGDKLWTITNQKKAEGGGRKAE